MEHDAGAQSRVSREIYRVNPLAVQVLNVAAYGTCIS